MSFVDTVKYVNQLAVVDEFGGRGLAEKIRRFYIVFRATDECGNELQVSEDDVKEAVIEKDIIVTNYIGSNEWTISCLLNDHHYFFALEGSSFVNGVNIITVRIQDNVVDGYGKPVNLGNTSICVKFKKNDAELISSCYLSDFPSTFFLSK